MNSPGGRLLHLAAAVGRPWDGPRVPAQTRGEGRRDGGPPAHRDPDDARDAEADTYVELARLAESGGLDFVTFDGLAARSGPDVPALLSRVASATGRVGLVAAIADDPADPRLVATALAALGRACHDRAGWRGGAPAGGRGPDAATLEQVLEEAESALAGPDGDAVHGDPVADAPLVRLVDITGPGARRIAARRADVALVRAVSPAQAEREGDELRSLAAESGRDPRSLRVLAALRVDLGGGESAAEPAHGGGGPRPSARGPLYRGGPVGLADLVTAWHGAGAVDGFHLTPVAPRRDLERLVNGTVALLQHRGLFRTFYPGSTLREHLGLARPAPRRSAARQGP
ncbi:LLM class flavin-dependent oxidoreductase [Streptomyces sp. NPDC008150]|uniref:LLM class flavin-dependent oxidoreductase n=1 Tax=Streptomyces sp. NPDC008150 TaxID=3364816 RepID=UPI0036EBFC11